ncbi:hypothetical protein TNCV_1400881 [Trichonephila clavipes]|nr:hypothetical protein TNCV_1400881 [Trichonephila clavipes]
MYHAQFPDQRIPDHRTERVTRSFHITKHDAGQQRAERSPNLEESILNSVAVRPASKGTSFESGRISSPTVGEVQQCELQLDFMCAEQL